MSFANFNTLKLVSEKLPNPLFEAALAQTPLTDQEAQKYDRITKEMMIPPYLACTHLKGTVIYLHPLSNVSAI